MSLQVNEGKSETIETSTGLWSRHAIKTHFVQVGESFHDLIEKYITPVYQTGDIVTISEKVISLCQGRVVYKKDMKISRLAKFLSRFASTSDAGIGVHNVYKMQVAIDLCGSVKVFFAAVCGGIGKVFGRKGIFYDIVGEEIRGLDGFYDGAYEEYANFGILLPENPKLVCNEIYQKSGVKAVIVDVNDFTCDILGIADSIPYSSVQIEEMIVDNPSGQSNQQTPFVLIHSIQSRSNNESDSANAE